jgi:LacI family transcriptional regulator
VPTLQDVAKLAGVSTATVSKVLSNTPYFSEATRQKVMAAVEQLDYRPNLAARALSSGKTHIIAVVFPYIYDAIFKDPHVMALLEGIESITTEHGYNLLLSTPRIQSGHVDEGFHQLIRSGYIEGVIAIDNVPEASIADVANSARIPVVVIGHHEAQYQVYSDDFLGGQRIMQHMLEIGHEHIGIISVPENLNFALHARWQGVRHEAQEQGLNPDDLPIIHADLSTKGGAQAMQMLYEQQPHITAVIALNDRMAMGAIQYLQAKNIRVPEDISVAGYDNLAITSLFTPTLTTVDQQAITLGEIATSLLFDVLANNKPSSVVLPPELIVRLSTCAPHKQ